VFGLVGLIQPSFPSIFFSFLFSLFFFLFSHLISSTNHNKIHKIHLTKITTQFIIIYLQESSHESQSWIQKITTKIALRITCSHNQHKNHHKFIESPKSAYPRVSEPTSWRAGGCSLPPCKPDLRPRQGGHPSQPQPDMHHEARRTRTGTTEALWTASREATGPSLQLPHTELETGLAPASLAEEADSRLVAPLVGEAQAPRPPNIHTHGTHTG
jgi:hypothetical protein